MKIDLRELEEGKNESFFEESPEELNIEDAALHFADAIRTRLTMFKLGDSYSADGESAFQVRQECARCLKPFDLHLTSRFRFVFQKGRPDRMEGDEDETLLWLDDGAGKIDLGEQVKDYILLEIPISPICDESCAGLCTLCGQNLNVHQCKCKRETSDPRWEALRTFKE